jgi:hypothetical protein
MIETIPRVKRAVPGSGLLDCSGGFRSAPSSGFASLLPFVTAYFPCVEGGHPAPLAFIADSALPSEGYRLDVDAAGVRISAAGRRGAFHALQTLRQLVTADMAIEAVAIVDEPDLALRGFMMDVSRDKIPTMATVCGFIDAMAAVKMNHFELYVEGFSFAYPSFPSVWKEGTPFTPEEYREIDAYCREREIDFVPNLNGFGHMSAWLARPEYAHLAEKEDGFEAWGFHHPPSTLNPLDPESFDLVRKMYADMLPTCSSGWVNINGDEPFELGLGKSAAACARLGREEVYLDFIRRLCDEAARHGKKPMMWGDVLVSHPDVVGRLPRDVVFIDWGYDHPYPFDGNAAALRATGVSFAAAPGTSTWNSIAGRRRDMLATTDGAAAAMKRHGGLGVIQTDWGDNGHLQYLPFSWPGMLEAAGAGWSVPPSAEAVAEHIDRFLIGTEGLGKAILRLSDYSRLERMFMYNQTIAFLPYLAADPAAGADVPTKTAALAAHLGAIPYGTESAAAVLGCIGDVRAETGAVQDGLVADEILAACGFIEAGVLANLAVVNGDGSARSAAVRILDGLTTEHARLWRLRNREGGLARSLSRPMILKKILASVPHDGNL